MKPLDKRGDCPKCGAFTYVYKNTECCKYINPYLNSRAVYKHPVIEVTCVCCGFVAPYLPLDEVEESTTLSVCKPEDELGYCPRCHTRNTTDTPRRDGVLDCVCNECGAKYTETPSEL